MIKYSRARWRDLLLGWIAGEAAFNSSLRLLAKLRCSRGCGRLRITDTIDRYRRVDRHVGRRRRIGDADVLGA